MTEPAGDRARDLDILELAYVVHSRGSVGGAARAWPNRFTERRQRLWRDPQDAARRRDPVSGTRTGESPAARLLGAVKSLLR